MRGYFLTEGFQGKFDRTMGRKFLTKPIRQWLGDLGVRTLHIEPGSPCENGYIESFNGKLRDELLNIEFFTTLFEAQVLIENWRRDDDQIRPPSALSYCLLASEAIMTAMVPTRPILSAVP